MQTCEPFASVPTFASPDAGCGIGDFVGAMPRTSRFPPWPNRILIGSRGSGQTSLSSAISISCPSMMCFPSPDVTCQANGFEPDLLTGVFAGLSLLNA